MIFYYYYLIILMESFLFYEDITKNLFKDRYYLKSSQKRVYSINEQIFL